ncbi:MAG: BREX-2 system adenine-specific DNA-methyltransferase PglX [Streptosporangiaceae bacterium]
MIDRAELLADLKGRVRVLEDDLRIRSADVPEFNTALRDEWQEAHDAERIAASYEQWLDGEITQAAVAWILGTVFLRFCEDNELIELPYLAGPGERLVIAAERQQAFFEQNPAKTDREWIIAGFDALSDASPVAAGLFDRAHNPMWRITPSHDAAKALLAFWRTRGERENSPVVHDFKDPDWNTRFLGDLYQDLSEYAKKTYALLQTPEFVEEFILDLTLTPAIDEFGLEPGPPRARPDLPSVLRVIDPACGSGHFLLGAFARLLDRWKEQAAITDPWVLITRVLSGLHGVDKNPFAVSIARFRLLLAAMNAGNVKHFSDAPDFPLNIAVGDSLLHGRGGSGEQEELFGSSGMYMYQTEDVGKYSTDVDILGANSYHVVVGNPPYITVKDKKENENYRKAYSKVCSGKYALSVPFADRFFHLAQVAGADRRGAGYVGQITANSFMKREFGKNLIEDLFRARADLTHVIDTSGAYIPGHGTPTVILVGRNMSPTQRPVRTVLSVRGEPTQPKEPAKGNVWQAIVNQINQPGSDSEWVSTVDLPRSQFALHPWSLRGGGSIELTAFLEDSSARVGDYLKRSIGFAGFSANDEAFYFPLAWHKRHGTPPSFVRPLIPGKEIKSWRFEPQIYALTPYSPDGELVQIDTSQQWSQQLWTAKRSMQELSDFSGRSRRDSAIPWWSWYHWINSRNSGGDRIIVAKISTHNEAAINSRDTVTNQHVFVLQLAERYDGDTSGALLGVLNSSTACFWLKQVSHDKGNRGEAGGITSADWERHYEFTGARLQEFPLPTGMPLDSGNRLDALGRRLTSVEPLQVCTGSSPSREQLDRAHRENSSIRGRMIALQEELDWEVYRLYGLLTDYEASELQAEPDSAPELKLGERAFEIVLARRMAAAEIETQWFARHGSTPITEVPVHWPDKYRRVVERRIDIIGKRRDIALIERPECKRRWSSEPWEKKERAALRSWLLDRCEDRRLWFALDELGIEQARPMTASRLADRLRADGEFVSVARLYAGQDAEISAVVAEITDTEHVPYLAALRYKDSGLRKRSRWQETWEQQRQEDAIGKQLNIPVPPKYVIADFRKPLYWSHRGRLDVPKERFISYPQASPDGDGSMLLGWAGWDHRQQAHALMTIIEDRTSRDGWPGDRLVPLIAGLAEVLPWVRQWHGDIDPAFGMSPADAYAGYLEDQQLRHGVTASDLSGWRPQATGRGRRPTSKPRADTAVTALASPAAGTDPVDTQTRHTPTP